MTHQNTLRVGSSQSQANLSEEEEVVGVVEEEEGAGEVVEVRMGRAVVSYKYFPSNMKIEIVMRNFSGGFNGYDLF